MKTIDSIDLGTVHGGADPRDKVVLNKLESRYSSQGVVSLIGKPNYGAPHNGIEHVTGKFDTNALWGGDVKRSFSGNLDMAHNKLTGLRTRVIGSE